MITFGQGEIEIHPVFLPFTAWWEIFKIDTPYEQGGLCFVTLN
ncbi:hypothetical protein EDD73_11445 [Heliophilum fasciatum]|uniref:Uncharacterized protein n=1 Tax=Heliophilum fasciatum TaxID=35700 RepID=A0A4R2RNL1_9FIRM|nr:hypothetical protein [Heliophilum fasciatum]TCP63897.1 hypothetical protein EDD73_11445 [Heliophilum fasciatum]